MFNFSDPETYWLNITNIVLGLVTVVCIAAVGTTVFREMFARARQRVSVRIPVDDHTFDLSGLGITMADGGEKIDEPKSEADLPDEQNIYRSNN